MSKLEVVTARYQNPVLAERTDLVKVCTSRGLPRMPLRYRYVTLKLLAPSATAFHIEDEAEFERAYTAGLEAIGVVEIVAALRELSEAHGGAPLALLCYEDVRKPGQWCHRRILAGWLEQRAGLVVPELGEEMTESASAGEQQERLW